MRFYRGDRYATCKERDTLLRGTATRAETGRRRRASKIERDGGREERGALDLKRGDQKHRQLSVGKETSDAVRVLAFKGSHNWPLSLSWLLVARWCGRSPELRRGWLSMFDVGVSVLVLLLKPIAGASTAVGEGMTVCE